MILYILICLLSLEFFTEGGKIKVIDSNDITDMNYIDLFIPSYPIIVTGKTSAIDLFDESLRSELLKMVKKGNANMPDVAARGIPPSNWVKFKVSRDQYIALFSYKSIHRCIQKELEGSNVVNSIDIIKLKSHFDSKPEIYFSLSGLAQLQHIHTVTTVAYESYNIHKTHSKFTSINGAHSDIRIIPFLDDPKCYFDRNPVLKKAKMILSGSVRLKDWTEAMFVTITDQNFEILKSWILQDPNTASSSRSQKNWLPFWDQQKCKLMFSKRYGPQHVVSEFPDFRSDEEIVKMPDTIVSVSPAEVPSDYMIRGSAPVVVHPKFEKGLALGCVHLRGRLKSYRHALYIMETSYPYHILSFSPLFAFKPFRSIEFVMSIVVKDNYDIELTHGSSDCEPRIAIFNWTLLNDYFGEYVKRTQY